MHSDNFEADDICLVSYFSHDYPLLQAGEFKVLVILRMPDSTKLNEVSRFTVAPRSSVVWDRHIRRGSPLPGERPGDR